MARPTAPRPVEFDGISVAPGERGRADIPVARLTTGTWMYMPAFVIHGARRGPSIFLDAAIHGDELNGIEIIRRVMKLVNERELAGTILAVPVVNGFGLVNGTRYLPDRRDLNRSFPGSKSGSLAGRIARLFLDKIVARTEFGIDLHTGSGGRTNLPQVRGDLEDARTRRLARAFGAPCVMQSSTRPGSLRDAASRRGVRVIVYEGGEAGRFGRRAVSTGVDGVLRVLGALDMVEMDVPPPAAPTFTPTASAWVRAKQSGLAHFFVRLGDYVRRGDDLGLITDTCGDAAAVLRAPNAGLVIGLATNPHTYRGDALVHVAEGRRPRAKEPRGRA